MKEIAISLVERWNELEYDLTHNYQSRIEIAPYELRTPHPDLPSYSYSVYCSFLDIWGELCQLYWNLLDTWDEVGQCSNRTMAKNINTVFFVEYEQSLLGSLHRRKDELPLGQILQMPHSGVWSLVACSLSPESVKEIAKLTKKFDLDAYLVHFEAEADTPPDKFPDKQTFKTYSQAWLDLLNLAADSNSGFVLFYQW